MNTQITGAQTRRKLSLQFGGKRLANAHEVKRAQCEIPNHELRRLVAAMVD